MQCIKLIFSVTVLLTFGLMRDIGGSFRGNTFWSPEAGLLLISTKNCDFWAVQHRKSAIPSNLAENTKPMLCAYSENWVGLASYADVLRLVTRA